MAAKWTDQVSTDNETEHDAPQPRKRNRHIGAKLIALLIVVVLAIIAYYALGAFLPRWWAQTVADRVHRSFGLGIGYGLAVGFVFLLLPLIVLRQVFRRSPGWGLRIVLLVLAVILAIPNLLTLAIAWANGNAARAADQILNVDAPGFRGACLGGAVLGLLVFALVQVLFLGRRRTRRKAKAAEADYDDENYDE